MSDVRAQGTTGPGAVPQGTTPATASRVVPLEVGQRVQATVVALGPQGRVVIGLLGGQVEARAELPLEVGRTYDLVVRSVHPEIRLSGAPPANQSPPTSVPMAALGPGNAELTRRLATLLAEVAPGAPRADGDAPAAAFARLRRGEPSGVDLRTVVAASNREEVLRWLAPGASRRMPPPTTGSRGRVGSQAARDGERAIQPPAGAGGGAEVSPDATRTESRREAVGAVLEALAAVDQENARRVRLRAPLWIPLPLADEFAHEGRMFLLAEEPEQEARPAGVVRPVRLVLLLDLVRLGWVRADVEVFDDRVNVTFAVVEEHGLTALDEGLGELRSALDAAGLRPATLRARLVTGSSLPVADLLAPAGPRRRGLVDVHV